MIEQQAETQTLGQQKQTESRRNSGKVEDGGFRAGRMLTRQEQEVKFRLTQSHNQTWQKD